MSECEVLDLEVYTLCKHTTWGYRRIVALKVTSEIRNEKRQCNE